MAVETITNGVFNFDDIKLGDTFISRQIYLDDEDGNTPSVLGYGNLVEVRIKFKQGSETGTTAKYIYVGSGIVIDSAADWKATIQDFQIDSNFEIGLCYYDIEFTSDTGRVLTVPEGTMEILQDITDA